MLAEIIGGIIGILIGQALIVGYFYVKHFSRHARQQRVIRLYDGDVAAARRTFPEYF